MRLLKLTHDFGTEYILKIGRTTFEYSTGRFDIVHKGRVVLALEF
ncbi:hypothetical protein ORI89_18685 [Sphingobacterium sp. UT-1RO-CII-1]|nr:hypothetical protein [Sphingobacterium sp. UT-1RO-CII-1]MCY4781684.1 hypothetical protein [Sphingobacterium sp. UT-1RO-CII-1]